MKKIILFLILFNMIALAQNYIIRQDSLRASEAATKLHLKSAIKDSLDANIRGWQNATDVSNRIRDSLTANARNWQTQTQVESKISDSLIANSRSWQSAGEVAQRIRDSLNTNSRNWQNDIQVSSRISDSLSANVRGWQTAQQVRSVIGDSLNANSRGWRTQAQAKQDAIDTFKVLSVTLDDVTGNTAYAIVQHSGAIKRILLDNLPIQLQVQLQLQALLDSVNSLRASIGGIAPTNPLPVTNLTAIAGDQKVTLNWINPTIKDSIVIERASSLTGGTIFSRLANVGITQAYVDTPLTNGTTYTYRLRVYYQGFASNYAIVDATPNSPYDFPYYLTITPTSVDFDTVATYSYNIDSVYNNAETDNQNTGGFNSGGTTTRTTTSAINGTYGYESAITDTNGITYYYKSFTSNPTGDSIEVECKIKIPSDYVATTLSDHYAVLALMNDQNTGVHNDDLLAQFLIRGGATNPYIYRVQYRTAFHTLTTVTPTSVNASVGSTHTLKIVYIRNADNSVVKYRFYVNGNLFASYDSASVSTRGIPKYVRYGVVVRTGGTLVPNRRIYVDDVVVRGLTNETVYTNYKYATVKVKNDSSISLTIRDIVNVSAPFSISYGDTALTRLNAGDTVSYQIRFDDKYNASFNTDSLIFTVEYPNGINTHNQIVSVKGTGHNLGYPSGVIAADYYFDAVLGDDSNNGTSPVTPWKTVNKFNNTTFPAGSIIAFRDSMDYIGQWVLTEDGTSIDSIVITNYYGSSSQKYPRFIHSGTTKLLTWSQTPGYTNIWQATMPTGLSMLTFEGTDSIEYGWYKSGLASLTNEYDCYWSGGNVYIYSPTNPSTRYRNIYASNTTVLNQTFYLQDADYIQMRYLDFAFCNYRGLFVDRSDNTKIQNCNFYFNQTLYISSLTNQTDGGNGVEIVGSTNVLVQNCKAWENGSHGYYIYGLNGRPTVDNITFDNCDAWDNHHTIALDVNGNGGLIRNVTFKNGLSYKTASFQRHRDIKTPYEPEDTPSFFITGQGGIGQTSKVWLINNVVYQTTGVGIQLEYYCDTTYLYNNTVVIYDSSVTGYRVPIYRGGGDNGLVEIKNNILYTATTNYRVNDCRGGSNIVQQNNLYWRQNGVQTLVSYVAMGTGDVFANPLFVNFNNYNYQITSSSPARDTGQNLSTIFTTDNLGISRPQGVAWDKGAYEYVP